MALEAFEFRTGKPEVGEHVFGFGGGYLKPIFLGERLADSALVSTGRVRDDLAWRDTCRKNG